MNAFKPYAKALVLLLVIVVVAVLDLLGIDLGLDIEHYVGLLIADIAVWAVPNKSAKPTK